jgi:hypothetical protein
LFTLLFALSTPLSAQDVDRDAFIETAKLVSTLGAMPDSSLKGIVGAVTSACNTEACSLYGIYMWAAQNIALECPRSKHPEKQNNSASYVLQNREANSIGFANLIAEMCKLKFIKCDVIEGLSKVDADDIGHVDNEANAAAWNIVLISKRRYVLDASWGAGYCDGKHFVKQLTDAWFLGNRRLFALSHFPKDKRSQLLDTTIERSEFVTAPIIGPMAGLIGLLPTAGMRGTLRGRAGDTLRISFEALPILDVRRISGAAVSLNERRIPVSISKRDNMLEFAIPLPEEGAYSMTLLINSAPAFGFQVQAAEARKKRS